MSLLPFKNHVCTKYHIGTANNFISDRRTVYHKTPTSSLAHHAVMVDYSIDFDNTKTLVMNTNLRARIIREATKINKRTNSMNKQDDA